MATGERFRSGGARGIAHFLSEHQDHDAGFDVEREPGEGTGTGRLTVTCRACGESIEYRANDAGEIGATEADLLNDGTATARADAAPAAAPMARPAALGRPLPEEMRRSERRHPGERSRVPRWLASGAIALLIVGGLVMILVGVLRDNGGEQSSVPSTQPAATQTSQAGGQSTHAAGGGGQTGGLQRQTFSNRFSIGVAPGWQTGEKQGATALTASGDVAEIDIYFQKGESSPSALAQAASSFLERRHPNGKVGAPSRIQFAGSPAVRVGMTYPGGGEVAVSLTNGGYTYALLTREDKGANPEIQRQAQQQLNSFRPL